MAGQPPTSLQRTFWNGWNASYREHGQGGVSLEQADVVVGWLRRLGRTDLEIIDIGCGAGWLCSRLTPFGRVTGTDLSDEVLARARERAPDVEFIEGDFMALDLGHRQFDVAVSLEVLSHVADQAAFLEALPRSCVREDGSCWPRRTVPPWSAIGSAARPGPVAPLGRPPRAGSAPRSAVPRRRVVLDHTLLQPRGLAASQLGAHPARRDQDAPEGRLPGPRAPRGTAVAGLDLDGAGAQDVRALTR